MARYGFGSFKKASKVLDQAKQDVKKPKGKGSGRDQQAKNQGKNGGK